MGSAQHGESVAQPWIYWRVDVVGPDRVAPR
jgi:hypothetical protein